MNFIVFSAVSSVLLIVVPAIVASRFRAKWKMPKRMFVKTGIMLLIVEVFYFTVVSNLISFWPEIETIDPVSRALILGLIAGLFFELGRYVVLDKVMKQVRSWREGIYFGFCWGALETVLLGIILLISVFGMQAISVTPDIAATIPNATTAQIDQLKTLQDETLSLMKQSPFLAFSPVLERASLMVIDIALSLLMILGFYRGTTKFAWGAVFLRTLFMASTIYVGSINVVAGEAVFAVYAVIFFLFIKQIRKFFPEQTS